VLLLMGEDLLLLLCKLGEVEPLVRAASDERSLVEQLPFRFRAMLLAECSDVGVELIDRSMLRRVSVSWQLKGSILTHL
jgi:hypothetical protein